MPMAESAMPLFWKITVIIGFILMMLVPFVLLRDIYPFFRFGMFAEPIEAQVSTERFVILTGANKLPLPPEEIGLKPTLYEYVLRNHWYRQEGRQLLNEVSKIDQNRHEEYHLAKVTSNSVDATRDTIILISHRRP